MPKQIHLTLVEQGGPAADSGLWNHPEFATERNKDPRYWEQLARILEDARFDAIFFADTPGFRSDTPAARDHHLRSGGVPRLDPAYIIPLMAAVTERLNFTVTSSISYDHPYALARKFSTLDHLTDGRIGWNIVASNVKSAAVNHGLPDQLAHGDRYDRGDEFLEVAYALWNHSWEDGAVVRDPGRGLYVDPALVRRSRTTGPGSTSTRRTWPSPPRSGRRSCSRRARPTAAAGSPRPTPSASTSTRSRSRRPATWSRTSGGGRRRSAVTGHG